MAETEVVDPIQDTLDTKVTCAEQKLQDAYAPEEPAANTPASLLDTQMPETPESAKVSDGDTSRLESPKLLKPVLGKAQAKKRLMAFANKYNILPKPQSTLNPSQKHSAKILKLKEKMSVKTNPLSADTNNANLNMDPECIQQFHNRPAGHKAKKKTEEKVLAIEEIRREESKSKMLLAEAIAAASLDEDICGNRNGQSLLESIKNMRERGRQGEASTSKKADSKSPMGNKHSERHRQHLREDKRDSETKESKEYSYTKEFRQSQDKEYIKRDREKRDDRNRWDVNSRSESTRDRKEEEKEKQENIREKKEVKEKREKFREKGGDQRSMELNVTDKKDKDKSRNKSKERNITKSCSWSELKRCGLIFDEIIDGRRREYSEKSIKNRAPQDYVQYLEQMLMLNNYRLKRSNIVVDGLDGPKEYPPESIRVTKRGKPQLIYSENSRVSLFFNRQQLLQSVTEERREKIRDICDANFTRHDTDESEDLQRCRNWYQKTLLNKSADISMWRSPGSVQFPKSKWDSEDDERLTAEIEKEQAAKAKLDSINLKGDRDPYSSPSTAVDGEDVNADVKLIHPDNDNSIKNADNSNRAGSSPLIRTAGEEKLASEYEQFMKMVCTDIPSSATSASKDFSPRENSTKSTSPANYHEFNLETSLSDVGKYAFMGHDMSNKSRKIDSKMMRDAKLTDNESVQSTKKNSKSVESVESSLNKDSRIQTQYIRTDRSDKESYAKDDAEDSRSIPSDWENVQIKVERMSDDNSDAKDIRQKKKKKQKKVSSSSDSSSTSSSSSDSEEDSRRRKRNRKMMADDSTSSDSDSSDSSSSSSSDSSSSDERRKKRKKRKRNSGKRKKKAKRVTRTKKKRRRKESSDSSSSDSDDRRKRKVTKNKRSKQRTQFEKQDSNTDIMKVMQSTSLESPTLSGDKLACSQTPVKRVKEEDNIENRKRFSDKREIWNKQQEFLSVQKAIAESNVLNENSIVYKHGEKRNKADKKYLEEWEVDSAVASQRKDEALCRKGTAEKLKSTDASSSRRLDKSDDRDEKDERSKKYEHIREKRLSMIRDSTPEVDKQVEDVDMKKKKKKDKEKRGGAEFLGEWERESERMIPDDIKLAKQMEALKKEKWGETEFDTLNVLSLTQLEKEANRRQLIADEWEVDSLEAMPDLSVGRKKQSRRTKKVEKEVRYDKETDTYIAIEKETAKEKERKKQDRLCAIRIWEEEEEEGEKEAMMLMQEKLKRKRDDWDVEEGTLPEKIEIKEDINTDNTLDTTSTIQTDTPRAWAKVNEDISIQQDIDKSVNKLEITTPKKTKKSRWDMGSQSEDKVDLKVPVMWEEECTDWTKLDTFEDKIAGHRKSMSSKNSFNDEIVGKQQLNIRNLSTSGNPDVTDLFPRNSQEIKSLDRSWSPEEHSMNASKITSLDNELQETSSISKAHPDVARLKDMLDLDVALTKRNIELYSPSSPALSQKSEDEDASDSSSSSSSSSGKEEMQLENEKEKDPLLKSDDYSASLPSIPLQLKFREKKYKLGKSILNDEFEHSSDIKSEETLPGTRFDMKNIVPLNSDPCTDTQSYKTSRMDIFAEYESDESRGKLFAKSPDLIPENIKEEDTAEVKAALKLIPKQLLVRRCSERSKTKSISETGLPDPVQHAAALLTIQKKLLESHGIKHDVKDTSCNVSPNEFKLECENIISDTAINDTNVNSKDTLAIAQALTLVDPESLITAKLDFDRDDKDKTYDTRSKGEDFKKSRHSSSKDTSDTDMHSGTRSPSREQRKRSPSRKGGDRRSIGDSSKDRRDRERMDKRDGRKKSSPTSSRGRRKRSASPRGSWERERSCSKSRSRSWSRSRSKSPRRRDERIGRSRNVDDRRERPARSPSRSSSTVHNKDHFKKYGSSKGDRDDWNKRKYDNAGREREKDVRSYDPLEMLREHNMDSDRHRENRFREEEDGGSFWQYETDTTIRDTNELVDPYSNGQDLDLEYQDRYYRDDSLDREIMLGPSMSRFRKGRGGRSGSRKWEEDTSDLDRHGRRPEKLSSSRSRSPGRSRHSPDRSERYRRSSRSRSRSWSRSRSRTRSRSRSRSRTRSRSRSRSRSRTRTRTRTRSRSRSRSRSTSRSRSMRRSRSRTRSRSRSRSRSRTRSTSRSRLKSPDHGLRMSERHRSSRSSSLDRNRISESARERKDEHDNRNLNTCSERGRRIETIVQSVSGLSMVPADATIIDSEMHVRDSMEAVAANFQYSNESQTGNEYYYTEHNLTYPPCIDDSTTSSPKRLSLDDRLELELGIKKQQEASGMSTDYSDNFNANVVYPSPPTQQMYRQQPTVLQVGNVLQVVPADFNGVPQTRREIVNCTPAPITRGSSQVVRVGNVLQVVPTSLDWSGSQSSTIDQPASEGILYSGTVSQHSPVPAPISAPVPVPVPLPVPAVPPALSTSVSVPTVSPVPLPLSIPVPVPVPVPVPMPITTPTFPRTEIAPPKIPAQPVYNYEVILETRRKEKEERKRVREMRRKEKERRRIERINRRALRLLEKSNLNAQQGNNSDPSDQQKMLPPLDPSVLKALRDDEELPDAEEQSAVQEKQEDKPAPVAIPVEEEDVPADEDEEEDEEEEPEPEDDEEDEEEPEEDEEEEEDDEEKAMAKINHRRTEVNETTAVVNEDASKTEVETEPKDCPELPPPPLKGILIASGFRRLSIPNGNVDDLSSTEYDSEENTDKEDGEGDKNTEFIKDDVSGQSKPIKPKISTKTKSKLARLSKKRARSKKSVQFADGIKPGEGTSPSGGEGDMPSPPPPSTATSRDGTRETRRSSSRKSRKQEKRARPPKAKKKVKVKIIKLKKPRITPLTAMIMDDSDELDDLSPPPPPPGSPPPPHLWPSYLSAYNSAIRPAESQTTPAAVSATVAAPPPTPLPLLVPPPPLNYTIQPCSKA